MKNPSGRRRAAWAVLATLLACMVARDKGRTETASQPPELAAAQAALSRNVALGDSLAGGPATAEQAAEAEKLVEEGLAKARAYCQLQPRSAQGHHVAGMLLLFSYRPLVSKVTTTDEEGKAHEQTLTVLRRGRKEVQEEGLAELRAAGRLAPADTAFQLDYAEALLMCDQTQRGCDLVSALWRRKANMTPPERARAAGLGARSARSQNQPGEEQRWLREVIANDPSNEAARQRLAELAPAAGSGIAWQSYEAGMNQGKPVMVDFMASWCGWCKKLDAEVYTNAEVLALSRQFVCIKVDGDRRPDLVRSYRVEGYPTILFLDAQGKEANRVVGFEPAQQFLAEMRKGVPAR